jgi:glycosyltransferase involved in cell wall biosynthesis
MKVSVIVPCYKFSEHIGECLSSILIQKTNFDFEILIRDDFSNDGSEDIIEKFAFHHPKIKHFKSTENWGFHKNIKFLMEQSNSQYISYLDGDDFWIDEKKLQTQVNFLDSNPEYSMCFCGYWIQVNNDKSTLHLSGWQGPIFNGNNDFISEDFLGKNPVNSLTRVFRNYKGLFKEYFFDCHINDLPLNFELSKLGKIKFLDFPAGVYRHHSNSLTIELNKQKLIKDSINQTNKIIIKNL